MNTSGLPNLLEWNLSGRLAPYVQDARAPEGCPVRMIESHQPSGDMSDPPVSDLVITELLTPTPFSSDLGAGMFSGRGLPGQFVIVPPRVPTTILIDAPHRIRNLGIDARTAALWLPGDADQPLDFGVLHVQVNDDPLVRQTLHALWRELAAEEPAARLFVESAASALLARVALLAQRSQGREPFRGGLAAWQARRVTEYLNDHFAEQVGLDELAALVHLSPYHFARAFKTTVGLPPHRYQTRLRLERAQALLRDTDLTVTQVAEAVGYETPQALGRLFRRELSMSPARYRAQARR